jgi:hypothetical protein
VRSQVERLDISKEKGFEVSAPTESSGKQDRLHLSLPVVACNPKVTKIGLPRGKVISFRQEALTGLG